MSEADGVHASEVKVAEAADPLSAFYASAHLQPPAIEMMVGDSVPPPYHQLLVHDRDMTPTLEAHYAQTMSLKVLEKKRLGQVLLRRVLLVGDADGQVTEFGAIRIDLSLFDDRARQMILACHRPLGGILAQFAIEHTCCATRYFRVRQDDVIAAALGGECGDVLYGRHNQMLDVQRRLLAEVVEILPRQTGESR